MNYMSIKNKKNLLETDIFTTSFNAGFTLVEMLIVVVIVAILVSLSMPMYMRAVERSRATEAMSAIKAMNDSIYAYYIEKEACPTSFSQLLAAPPKAPNSADCTNDNMTRCGKYFTFTLRNSSVVKEVPGTDCIGVLAKRNSNKRYRYYIWNPYDRGSEGKAYALACFPDPDANGKVLEQSKSICSSIGILHGYGS